MKVTLLNHSEVLIELDHHILLFDEYQAPLTINKDKPLYIFASHSHGDHFSRKIFSIDHPDKHYILSDDIRANNQDYTFVKPHQTITIDDLEISTLFSTDLGVAFIVKVEGQTIYFAGDLHDWDWPGEPEEDNTWQTTHYLEEISLIKEPVDLACVVVDDRLEENTFKGFDEFLEHVNAKVLLPIHYFGHYRISKELSQHLESVKTKTDVLLPEHANHEFII